MHHAVENPFHSFLSSPTEKQWRKIGLSRRAGVSTPLFSLYSSKSTGIGEYPDLELLGEWCNAAGMSIIQLLPMNDAGFNFTPYDAASTFALDPMYLRLAGLEAAGAENFNAKIKKLQKNFPPGGKRVDYGIKKAKLELLSEIFRQAEKPQAFLKYVSDNAFWLPDYSLYKAIKEVKNETSWEKWEAPLKTREAGALKVFEAAHKERVLFHQWLQWQCFLQASAAKKKLTAKGVFLLGDLPFLVSRDSADVWSHQGYFKLDLIAGAPPDAFFANGQRWGMPPYNWPAIEAHGFDYLAEKVRYAENFYDMFRVDHAVGTFRLWTIRMDEPLENGGLNGRFDPEDESRWEEHGRKILLAMIRDSGMLPCAEDLGVVPECCPRTLENFAIPGMDVQRWNKEWGTTYDFKQPGAYRKNSAVVISNHDTTSFRGWWEFEAGTVDAELFKRRCGELGIDFGFAQSALFDGARSAHGRLRWKTEISGPSLVAEILGRNEGEIYPVIALYKESYGEKEKFCNYLGLPHGDYAGAELARLFSEALKKAGETASIFSIQLLQDLLMLENTLIEDAWEYRINFPGTSGPQNWSLVIPISLEKMPELPLTAVLREIHSQSGRI